MKRTAANGREPLARLSCTTCRKQKRKCSRSLPSCQLCRKNRRACDYPPEAFNGSDSDEGFGSTSLATLRNEFPRIFFLDSYLFKERNCSVPRSFSGLPQEFGEFVEDEIRLQSAVDRYFKHIHPYFPFISKIRFAQAMSTTPIDEKAADLALLLIAMQLVTIDQTDPVASADLYERTKRLALYLEGRGIVSMRLLQSHMLIALYEIGNAVHPAAYLTIGHCARLGHAIGIHDRRKATPMLTPTSSWTDLEEQRRIWWGVQLLDRYVNIGLGGRPFACADARPDDLLPQCEERWDDGEPAVMPSLAVSAATSIAAPPFARACQAADLLSRVLRHLDARPSGRRDTALWYGDAVALHRILAAFHAALSAEFEAAGAVADSSPPQAQPSLCSALGLCYSAQMALCDAHTCAERDHPDGVGTAEQLEAQGLALAGIFEACAAVHGFARRLLAAVGRGGDGTTSPFVGDCLYAAARSYLWYWKDSMKGELLGPLGDLVATLEVLGRRWRVAVEYVAILDGEGLQDALGALAGMADGAASASSRSPFSWSSG